MKDKTEVLPYMKLRLNLRFPDLESCYCDGYFAALEGNEEENNPYKLGSQESDFWLDGWWNGFYGEAPLFDLVSETYREKATSSSLLKPCQINVEDGAANDESFTDTTFSRVAKVAGAIAATAFLGYQLMDMMA